MSVATTLAIMGRDIPALVRNHSYNPAFMNPGDIAALGLNPTVADARFATDAHKLGASAHRSLPRRLERFPRLFRAVESIPGLTWPNVTFRGEMRIWLGQTEVRLLQLGRGHTKGDTVAWLPESRRTSRSPGCHGWRITGMSEDFSTLTVKGIVLPLSGSHSKRVYVPGPHGGLTVVHARPLQFANRPGEQGEQRDGRQQLARGPRGRRAEREQQPRLHDRAFAFEPPAAHVDLLRGR